MSDFSNAVVFWLAKPKDGHISLKSCSGNGGSEMGGGLRGWKQIPVLECLYAWVLI